jgi:drug/metabolite transporter (DMT)-like permease
VQPRAGDVRGSDVFPELAVSNGGFILPPFRLFGLRRSLMISQNSTQPPRVLVLLAFAVVYIVWGSTYLAIRVVVETIPPFLSAAVRFLIAGVLLMAFLKWRGFTLPTAAQWRHSIVSGLLLSLGGNGLVVWAEQSISSGFAALLVALAPVWFALLDWLRPGGKSPQLKTIGGIAIGFCGVILLVSGRSVSDSHSNSLWAALAVVLAGILWAAGSLFAKYSPNAGSPWMNAAAQMSSGGVGLLFVSILADEHTRVEWSGVSARSWISLLYLIIFGSWIGFTAYVWLLRVSTPSRVSTYAYVNPVIAVFLGWAVLGETVSGRMALGALVVLAGVITITLPGTFFTAAFSRLRGILAPKPEGQGNICSSTD